MSATISLAITTTDCLVVDRNTELVIAANASASLDGKARIASAETPMKPVYHPVSYSYSYY